MLSTANVTIQFGSKPLFENVSIKFADRNRYGLIGANGSGKSTFMKVLSSDLAPSHGNVTVGPDMRVATLQQNQFAYEEHSVVDTVIMGHPELWAIKQERDRIYNLPEMSEEEGIKVAELESEFAELDGYSAEAKAGELLLGVEISQELHYGPMSEVPPGEKLRVLLCQVLFADPDIMLLDEPTNNLDINTIRWLEGELIRRNSTMVIISHDRHFLNSVCTHMADLDYGEIRLYPGNYDNYMMASTMKREQLLRNNAKKSDEMKELRAFISRFSANASKSRQATARQRKLDKIQLDDMPVSSRKSPYIRFDQEKDLHRNVLTIDNISKAFDENKLFSKLNLMVEAGQKIAIIGPNGIGKTTLLRCVANQLATDGGQVQWAENAQLGYFPQDHSDEFSEDLLLGDWIRQFAPVGADEQVVRATLGRLLFSGDDVKKKTSVLSGGEKGRMLFGKLILQQNNVLLMDEPTNHLDMESIESLNLALDLFEGTLIFVSHDREFVSSLATQIIEISDDDVVHYLGTYEEYLAKQGLAG